jgi:hypothetical protein
MGGFFFFPFFFWDESERFIRGWVCCFWVHLGVSNLIRDWSWDGLMGIQVEDNFMLNPGDMIVLEKSK